MASITLNVSDRHAPGVVVGAYPRANWASWRLPPSGAAVGAAIATGIVAADGTVMITGLANNAPYYAARSTGAGGYVSFLTSSVSAGSGAMLRYDGAAWPERGGASGPRLWISGTVGAGQPPDFDADLDVWLVEDDTTVAPHTHPESDVTGLVTDLATGVSRIAATLAAYRPLVRTGLKLSSAAAAGTTYFADGAGSSNISVPGPTVVGLQLLRLQAADYAVTGSTTKLRVVASAFVATAPAVTLTVGLYPVTAGVNLSLGTVVSGSTVAFASPGTNTLTSGDSGDFTLPSDGVYSLGAVVSGTPAATTGLQVALQVRNV